MANVNPYEPAHITVNVPVTAAERERLIATEQRWSGPRFVALCIVVLVAAFCVLYAMSSTTAEAAYPRWVLP